MSPCASLYQGLAGGAPGQGSHIPFPSLCPDPGGGMALPARGAPTAPKTPRSLHPSSKGATTQHISLAESLPS